MKLLLSPPRRRRGERYYQLIWAITKNYIAKFMFYFMLFSVILYAS
ncbi:MAG: hypothetical protein LBR79_04495 [Oscillospiraceae bacterium]|nr:hypothetical protein [Oscillospiraceae bacterium]